MSAVIELASHYLSSEVARNAYAALPANYKIECSFVFPRTDEKSLRSGTSLFFGSSEIVSAAFVGKIRERNEEASAGSFNLRPLVDLVEVIARDDDGNFESTISAKIFDFDAGFFGVPLTFPPNEGVVNVLGYLSFEERIGFLTELVRVFSNLVRFHSGVESLHSDLIRCLGQFVGLLSLAVRDYRDNDPSGTDDHSNHAGDDSPIHIETLSEEEL